jgi:hypothetical protein
MKPKQQNLMDGLEFEGVWMIEIFVFDHGVRGLWGFEICLVAFGFEPLKHQELPVSWFIQFFL